MTDLSTPYPVLLAQEISRKIEMLTERLTLAAPADAALIMEAVTDAEAGIMGHLSHLLAHASQYAHDRVPDDTRDLWSVLGRASNAVHNTALRLDKADLSRLALLSANPTVTPTVNDAKAVPASTSHASAPTRRRQR
jgi:hypothetical protein